MVVHLNLHPNDAKNSRPEGGVGCLLMETLEVLGRVRTNSPRVCMRPIHSYSRGYNKYNPGTGLYELIVCTSTISLLQNVAQKAKAFIC